MERFCVASGCPPALMDHKLQQLLELLRSRDRDMLLDLAEYQGDEEVTQARQRVITACTFQLVLLSLTNLLFS